MKDKVVGTLERKAIIALSSLFILWSIAYIYRASFIGIDGQRHFCLFDDAMITLRYAWNFAHGNGLAWNAGERVEGYSNLLWVLFMAPFTVVFSKLNAIIAIQVAGIAIMLGNAMLARKIAALTFDNEPESIRTGLCVLSFLGVLTYYPLVFFTLMGMETGFLTLFLLSGVLYALKYIRQLKSSDLVKAAVLMGFAFLTRNDSTLAAFIIFIFIIFSTRKNVSPGELIKRGAAAAGIYLVFMIGQLVFRYIYYHGELYPNTYISKLTGTPLWFRVRDGIHFIKPYLYETCLLLIVIAIDLIFNLKKLSFFLSSFLFCIIAYQVYVGGESWLYWRMMSPATPLAIIAFISAMLALVRAIAKTSIFQNYILLNPVFPRSSAVLVLTIGLTLLCLFVVNKRFMPQIALFAPPFSAVENAHNVNVALALNELTTPDASVAVFYAGTVPYITGLKGVDMLGKCDSYISHLPPDLSGNVGWSGMRSVPGHAKYDLDYSLKKLRPDFTEGVAWGSQNLAGWADSVYALVTYKDLQLYLLKNSPNIHWEKIPNR